MPRPRVFAVAAALVILVAGLFLLPRLIDQPRLRDWAEPQLRRALRQQVAISGPISLTLLPRPKVVIEDVTVRSDGVTTARLPRVEAGLQLLPLALGRLQPDEVRLVRPDITLAAAMPPIVPPASVPPESIATAPGAAPAASSPRPLAAPARIIIEQGRITLPANAGGMVLAPVDVSIISDGASTKVTGHLVAGAEGIAFTGSLLWASGQQPSVDIGLRFDQGGELHGTATGAFGAMQGKLSGKLPALGRLRAGLPALPVTLSSDLSWSEGEIEAKDLVVTLGDSDWRGTAQFRAGDAPRLEVNLKSILLNLDHLPSAPAPLASAPAAVPASPVSAMVDPTPPLAASLPGFGGLAIDLTLSVDQILWHGSALQDGRLSLHSNKGEFTINQASLTLPGNSEVSLFGVLSAGPRLTGSFEGKSDDLRELLHWGGLDVAGVPADRLHIARIAGEIKASVEQISLERVRLKLDSSQLDVAATYRPGAKPALGLTFALDLLNGDAYRPANRINSSPDPAPSIPPATAEPAPAVGGLDANISGHVGRLTWRGLTLQDVSIDAARSDGIITVNRLSIGDLAGAKLALTGTIAPSPDGLRFAPAVLDVKTPNLAQTLHAAGIDLPLAEPVDLKANLTGPITAPHVALATPQLDFGKLRLTDVKGEVSVAGDHLGLDGLSAGLFGGQLTGAGSLERASGTIALQLSLANAQMRQALFEFADIGLADGALEGDVALTSVGHFAPEIKAHLDGTAHLLVKNGQIKGFDLKAADRGLAQQPGVGGLLMLLQAGLSGGNTHFTSLSGSAHIDHGVITSNDLKLVADGGGAEGAARVDLPGDNIDAHADFRFASAADAPPLVMRLTGSLQSPRRFIDVKPLQQWLAEHGLKTGKPKDVLKSLLQGLVH
jgi:uncharacterized protein involved in outer membrane biogenesis